ncbi:uncharacterized protein [Nicotiana tomentosiformis]|uniref:uncharacterized protein n=1 Tax=Nicotiana tomentosiformis TaxID=4098 RepID=UPI00388C9C3B
MEYETVFLDTIVAWMPGVVPHLKNKVRSLVSMSTYAECAWRDLSKGRWEACTHGLIKDAVMRPSPGDKTAIPPISKLAMEIKRKRASNPEGQKPKKRAACKPNGNTIPLTMESVQRLRDEREEEEGGSRSVARARVGADIQKALESVGVDTAPSRLDKVEEETLTQVLDPKGTEDALPWGEEIVDEEVKVGAETGLEAPEDEDGAPKDLLGAIQIWDSSFPSFSQSMIHDAQAVEAYHGEGAHEEEDPFRGYFVGVEDVTGLGDSEASKKARARQEFLAYVLHHKREGEANGLRVELEAARKEQDDLSEQVKRIFEVNDTDSGVMANSSVPQVQQKFDVIRQLRVEVDAVKVEAEEWKKNMDRLASEKEAARAQLASVETQLRRLKEMALVQAKEIEDFKSRLGSATSDQERLATELASAKS